MVPEHRHRVFGVTAVASEGEATGTASNNNPLKAIHVPLFTFHLVRPSRFPATGSPQIQDVRCTMLVGRSSRSLTRHVLYVLFSCDVEMCVMSMSVGQSSGCTGYSCSPRNDIMHRTAQAISEQGLKDFSPITFPTPEITLKSCFNGGAWCPRGE